MDTVWGAILVSLLLGVVVGGIARILLPGTQRIGLFMTGLAGAVAAFIGFVIGDSLGLRDGEGFSWGTFGIQVLLAALVIGAIGGVGRRR